MLDIMTLSPVQPVVSHFEPYYEPRAIWPVIGKHDVIHKTGST